MAKNQKPPENSKNDQPQETPKSVDNINKSTTLEIHEENKRRRTTNILMAIIAILTIGITVVIILYLQEDKEGKLTLEEKEVIEDQKNKLEGELKGLMYSYDTLQTTNDSIQNLLNSEKKKISRLLKLNASNAYKIKLYEKELGTLRTVMQSYIKQIDSLNTKNLALTEENIKVRTQLKQVETEKQEVEKEKEELATTVEKAKVLKAINIQGNGVVRIRRNAKRVYTQNSKRLNFIEVEFTIQANPTADPGNKTIYLQLLDPNNVALESPEAIMTEVGGEFKVCAAKRDNLTYENKEIVTTITWTKGDEVLLGGNYTINLFAEGYLIGNSSFSLK